MAGLPTFPCPFRATREPVLPPGHLRWSRTTVQGRAAEYGEAGTGPPVLFLHGWGLGHHAYKRPLARLALRGCRVLAPALPGFGGTADVDDPNDIHAYGKWANAFLDAVGVDEPAVVIGHSFGGGVSITLAHDHPERVQKLVLVNSVGGAAWGDNRSLSDRPLASWVIEFMKEMWPPQKGLRLAFSVREDLLPNLVRNPMAMMTAGRLAAQADLRIELSQLRARELPVVVVSAQDDAIIPLSAFEALCGALGIEGKVLPGDHSWLLADPDAFDEVMGNVVGINGDNR